MPVTSSIGEVALLVATMEMESVGMPVAIEVRSMIARLRLVSIWCMSKAVSATMECSDAKIRHRVIKSSSMSSDSAPVVSIGYCTGGVMVAADAPARRFNEVG